MLPIFIPNKPIEFYINHKDRDISLSATFLDQYSNSPLTFRTYRMHIEKFLLWLKENKLTLRQVDKKKLLEYIKFANDPQPKDKWCFEKVTFKMRNNLLNVDFKPFSSKVSEKGRRSSISVVILFLKYLNKMNYISNDAYKQVELKKFRTNRHPERYIEKQEIKDTISQIEITYKDNDKSKNILIYYVLLFFYTGLRREEAISHTMDDIVFIENCYFLRVIGKGKKLRDIPLPEELMDYLSKVRQSFNLSPFPVIGEHFPLLPVRASKNISYSYIYKCIRKVFRLTADYYDDNKDSRRAEKMRKASPHWLRHSYVTYSLRAGIPIYIVQENAGHANINTTMIYTHNNHIERYEQAQKLKLE